MECLYVPQLDDDSRIIEISGDELHHLRVLRCRSGDMLLLSNGRGLRAVGRILSLDRKTASVAIENLQRFPGELPYRLTIAFGLLASLERIEWLIEKCTELGVHHITPLILERCQIVRLRRRERIVAKMIAAMKQAQRSVLLQLEDPITLEELLTTQSTLIACMPGGEPPCIPLNDCTLIVGTEGGFSPKEERLLAAHGVQRWSLGELRLRTETAAVVAASIIRDKWLTTINSPVIAK